MSRLRTKSSGARGDFVAARAAVTRSTLERLGLEVELEGEFYDSSTVFIHDLAEVINRILRKGIALGGITDVTTGAAGSIWSSTSAGARLNHLTGIVLPVQRPGVQSEKDITRTQATSRTELRWIGLIEYVKQAGPELEFL